MSGETTNFDPRGALQSQGPATHSLDAAVDYARLRGLRLLPAYVIAMLPMSILVLLLVDAICAQHRSIISLWCWWLLPATVWRWAGLAYMQQAVQADLQVKRGLPLHRRMIQILLVRLYANIVFTWGSMLVIPSFYGLFAGSFAAPLLLERAGSLPRESFRMLSWVHHSSGRLMRVTFALSAIALLLLLAVTIVQYVMVGLVFPSILGVDASSAALTFSSWAWRLSLWYFIFLGLDFFWTIAAVFLFYDSQSRRTGADLRARLQVLTGSQA